MCRIGDHPLFSLYLRCNAPFKVDGQNVDGEQLIQFNVVTSWELIEHIAEDDLAGVASNRERHLASGGLWIMSVSPNEEIINGVRLHQTVETKSWWLAKFTAFGWVHLRT